VRLKQNIDNVPVLIDSSPEVLLLTVDSHGEFIQIPSVIEATLSSF
jgi:hypothetical protein